MGEKPDQIREEIEQARNRLVRQTTDWRVQFDRRPWVFAGAAFTGALVFGWMLGHPRRAVATDRRDYLRGRL